MKQKAKYSKRFLAVLLAMLMLLAAAQPVSFVAAAGNDPDPVFGEEAVASARYTTNGTLELSFSEATSQGGGALTYYVDFYDLDVGYEQRGVPVNDNPVALTDILRTYDSVSLVSATISAQQIKELGLNMSHRISIAITAVDSDGWRSQPLEALVGESLSVPSTDSAPTDTQFLVFEDFEGETAVGGNENTGTPPKWMYNNIAGDEQTGNDNYTPANIDGISFGGDNKFYQTPGFNTSNALRVYLKNAENSSFASGSTPSSVNGYQRLDVAYTRNNSNFVSANEMWIWVDTSYVSFDEFALQVRYGDRTGTLEYWNDQSEVKEDGTVQIYSGDVYSTVGYANRNGGKSVPVYYQNEDGLWDTWYTNANGYLEDFGHYRGFLRVNIDYLLNENRDSSYADLLTERPYSYKIVIREIVWNHLIDGVERASFTAEEAFYNNITWISKGYWDNGSTTNTLDKNKFKSNTGYGLSVIPLENIASIGITWKGASEDSVNKSFYIDQMGFSGTTLTGGTPIAVNSLTASNADTVQALVEQYLPSDMSSINVSHASIISDLRTICMQLGVDNATLRGAEAALEGVLEGSESPVDWLSAQVDQWAEASEYNEEQISTIKSYFDLYQTLTLGDLYRLGSKNEAKLIQIYNTAGLSEWYPEKLGDLYYKSFNDVESNYEIGQTALHEYDDYRLGPSGDHYYDRGHVLNWGLSGLGDVTGAWENTRNLLAYSRMGYDDEIDDTRQRFGLGFTSVGQNGFDNSRSIDTSFYRDVFDSDGTENYRISLTYNGEEADNWENLPGGNYSGAQWFVFYADFTQLQDIRKIWVTLRTGNGNIYSHDEYAGRWTYETLSLDDADPEWVSRQTDTDNDGCLTSDLEGFRGFIRIPLSYFKQIGNNSVDITGSLNDVRQVKFFFSGTAGGASPAGTSISLDMFGFAANSSFSGASQMKTLAAPVAAPSYVGTSVESVQQLIDGLYENVVLLDQTEEQVDYLFNYNAESYQAMLTAYRVLPASEKDKLGPVYQTKLTDMAAFVKNYDPFGGVDGNLKKYIANANSLYTTVTDNFGKTALSAEEKNNVVSALNTYKNYPAKYQNTVLTYWADRNLSAVFPNFTVKTDEIIGNISADDPLIEMTLDGAGANYTGTGALPFYAAAAASPYDVELDIPDTVTLSMDDATITVPITGRVMNPTDPNTMSFNLTIPETSVEKSGVYTGSFNVTLKRPAADTGTAQNSNTISDGVPNAKGYRMETYRVYVKLICDASYTVVIPADVAVEWGTQGPVDAGALAVTEMFIPTAASIKVGVTSANDYKMIYDSFKLPYDYELQADSSPFREAEFDMATAEADLTKELQVEVTDWPGAPSDQYKDTLTFTVTYSEQ